MANFQDPAIPKGSRVLVTGANSLVGSNVADQFLQSGYRVRSAVRDPTKSAWLTQLFNNKYGNGAFEMLQVEDMSVSGAYDEAVKGVTAVVHAATVMTFDADPNKVIPPTIEGALGALKSAYAEPSVKRFVLTSSSSCAALSQGSQPGVIVTEETWNEKSIETAWANPPYTADRGSHVYAASKTQAEQEVWKFHRENQHRRPDLVVITVLQNIVMGRSLDPINQGYPMSSGFIVSLWNGKGEGLKWIGPKYFSNTVDVGLLHVAGAIHPDVKGARLFAYSGQFSWDSILSILRKLNSHRKLIENFSSGQDANDVKTRERAERLDQDGRISRRLFDRIWRNCSRRRHKPPNHRY